MGKFKDVTECQKVAIIFTRIREHTVNAVGLFVLCIEEDYPRSTKYYW